MDIQWFPGHMAKSRRLIIENWKLTDLALEVLDARIPKSSSNPDIRSIIPDAARMVVLNKSDLADAVATARWVEYFEDSGIACVSIDSKKGTGIKELIGRISQYGQTKAERLKKSARPGRTVKIMVVGIPNVGKSSLLNRLSGRSPARIGNRPGVTKGKQWVRVNSRIMLLDTPGILWPKFEDEETGANLAITGAIKDEVLDREELAVCLIEKLVRISPGSLSARYGIDHFDASACEVVRQIGENRGCLIKGGRIDTLRASDIILEDFRSGKLGRITLEYPGGTLG
jgi:ribosome biogenesis GTPase A